MGKSTLALDFVRVARKIAMHLLSGEARVAHWVGITDASRLREIIDNSVDEALGSY
ncbi:hypothetical protein GCM10027075_77150 [Streptomyces heilongjiangensis]